MRLPFAVLPLLAAVLAPVASPPATAAPVRAHGIVHVVLWDHDSSEPKHGAPKEFLNPEFGRCYPVGPEGAEIAEIKNMTTDAKAEAWGPADDDEKPCQSIAHKPVRPGYHRSFIPTEEQENNADHSTGTGGDLPTHVMFLPAKK